LKKYTNAIITEICLSRKGGILAIYGERTAAPPGQRDVVSMGNTGLTVSDNLGHNI
jgi:hypothetical protein